MTAIVIVLAFNLADAQLSGAVISAEAVPGSFPLISNRKLSIQTDPNDADVVTIAANLFAEDLQKKGAPKPVVVSDLNVQTDYVIIIGTLHKSAIIRELVETGKLDLSGIENQWETSQISIIENPSPDIKKALVIAGSDRRGTAYGVMDLSKMIGISPWNWWADVTPAKTDQLHLKVGTYQSGPPSVKYRGIFINDEAWGLQPWSSKTFEPGKNIGPETYEKIFELMLRMKANFIWPAMYRGTTPFYIYPENKKVADKYAIVLGSTHIEPLGRNNFYGGDGGEWEMWLEENEIKGEKERLWDWQQNADNMLMYWEERVIEMREYENIYTVGLRGLRDGPMSVDGGIAEQVVVLEDVIDAQRSLLAKWVNKDLSKIPQTFAPYKEVLEIYDEGRLQLPDEVTIIWPNDNHGYFRRLSLPDEKLRRGGTGVYYHISYLGRPHGYYWLATTHPSLVRNELDKAWRTGSDRIWILNVGDIKPGEYLTELFLDMGWNMEKFTDAAFIKAHLLEWVKNNLDEKYAEEIKEILWDYYDLAFERRPEFMGWNMTWPDIPIQRSEYNHTYYNDQIDIRISRYKDLLKRTEKIWNEIPDKRRDAFYQLVYYPVAGSAFMNKKFLYQDKAINYREQNRMSANTYAEKSMAAYDSIARHTDYYNNSMSDGKWKHMMSMNPRDLRVFQKPEVIITDIPNVIDWGIAPEGMLISEEAAEFAGQDYHLPVFPMYSEKHFYIDLFLKGMQDVTWKITPSDDWIIINKKDGTLSYYGDKESRIWVSVDKNFQPESETVTGHLVISGSGKEFKVIIEAFQPDLSGLSDFNGFIETNSYIVGHAENYIAKGSGSVLNWEVISGMGHSGKSLLSGPYSVASPVNMEYIQLESGFVEYEIYTFSSGPGTLYVTGLPVFPLNPDFNVRIGVSINDNPPVVKNFKAELSGSGRGNDEWSRNVLSNTAVIEIPVVFDESGKQKIRLYAIDPGVIIDWISLDLGGLKPGYGLLPETRLTIK